MWIDLKKISKISMIISTFLLMMDPVQAAPVVSKGTYFSHQDWEVACNNTRTCRAAGYQMDTGESLPMSVLFTRKAGARQPVVAEVKLGNADDEVAKPIPKSVELLINQTSFGKVALSADLQGYLSSRQINALLAALAGHTVIQFKSGRQVWDLSGNGAVAVLLKMDDLQGRVGTTSALLKKGNKTEINVLPAVPMPVVKQVKPVRSPALKQLAKTVDLKQLKKDLLAQNEKNKSDDCPVLQGEDNYATFELNVQPLNAKQLLASGLCWRGAYNEGLGYWVINAQKPYQPRLVTTNASDYADGLISSAQKGRGLGDCWSQEEWVWNGQQFVQTLEQTTGMCRMVELGGAWQFPTRTAKVIATPVR